MASNANKKCRTYLVDYIRFGFVPCPSNIQLPMCLFCKKILTNEAMKPSRLKDHLTRLHPDKADKSIEFFQALKECEAQSSINKAYAKNACPNVKGLIASYKIAFLIAKKGLPFNVGESLVAPAVKEIISTVIEKDPTPVLRAVPLSDTTVTRRINEMGTNIEDQLCEILRNTSFSLQLDETTTSDNNALLMVYVRYITDGNIMEELLFCKCLETDTKGLTIFQTLSDYLRNKSIPLTNIIACATDGAPAMVGRYRGFASLLKEKIPNLFTVHCVLHRQHLVAKRLSPRLQECLGVAIKAVNKIKANAKNDRLFRQLCEVNDEEFEHLLLHTEVRWLSKGIFLARYCKLKNSVVEFLGEDSDLAKDVIACHQDNSYLADFYEKINTATDKLQGKKITLVQSKTIIRGLINKLELYQQSLSRRKFDHFSHLSKMSDSVTDEHLLVYVEHLKAVIEDMKVRFKDLLDLEVFPWLVEPFVTNINDCDSTMQEMLIDLQSDEEARAIFRAHGWAAFWIKWKNRFPQLWEKVELFILAFPTTYIAEQGFSEVLYMRNKYRNRLDMNATGGDSIRLKLTSLMPAFSNLAEQHQPQGSH